MGVDAWFAWWFSLLPGPSICPKRTPMPFSLCQVLLDDGFHWLCVGQLRTLELFVWQVRKCSNAGNPWLAVWGFEALAFDGESETLPSLNQRFGSKPPIHGCCWDTFYIFAYCGLVVELQPLNC